MGLDMYLTARRHISEFGDKELSTNLNKLTNDIRKGYQVQGITVEAMYWRKATAIHNWFVKNVQYGIDDCKLHPVSGSQLKQLLDIVTYVLDYPDQADSELPTSSGFFFGDTEYNEWFFDSLKNTKEQLTKLLEDFGTDDFYWNFYYQSSW